MSLDDLKFAQRERLVFLDRCFTWRGAANRRDLVDRFEISVAQAALDFKAYLGLAPEPPIYHLVNKSYLASAKHRPLVPTKLSEAFDIVGRRDRAEPSAILPTPQRGADPKIISRLYQAIRSGTAVHIRYTSMSSDRSRSQWIAPQRFTSDGEAVHIRAYSFDHSAYRTYLPVRIELDSSFQERTVDEKLPVDEDWFTKVTIWLRPKTGLSDEQARVVRREFGFEDEFLKIETRKPLEFFFDHRWGIGEMGARLERAKTEYELIQV